MVLLTSSPSVETIDPKTQYAVSYRQKLQLGHLCVLLQYEQSLIVPRNGYLAT